MVFMSLQPRLIDSIMSAYRRLYFCQHIVVLIREYHVAAASALQLALGTHNEFLWSLSYQRLGYIMHEALSVALLRVRHVMWAEQSVLRCIYRRRH